MIADLKPYPAMRDSGFEWLGDVPEHWEVVQLGRIGRFSKGNGGTKEDEEPDGVACVRYGDLYTRHKFFIETSRSYVTLDRATNYTPLLYGDVLFAGSGETIEEIGKSAVNLIESEACCGGDVLLFRPSRDVVPRFMGYATDCPPAVHQKVCMGRGVTVMHIYEDHLKYMGIALPPIPEQTAIVRFLDHVDRRIRRYVRAKQKLIALLAEQRAAVTHDALRLASTRSLRLEVMADRVSRLVNRRGDQIYTPIGLFNRGRGIFHKEPTKGAELGDSTFFWIEEGDLVLSGQFAWEGAIAIAGQEDTGCIATHRYPILGGKPNLVESAYLLSFFKTGMGHLLLDQHSRGAAGRNRPLNARTLMKEKIPIPPLPVQQRITAMVHLENRLYRAVARSVELLREHQTRLTADVVTGKLDVREAAAQLPDEAEEPEQLDEIDSLEDSDEVSENADLDVGKSANTELTSYAHS